MCERDGECVRETERVSACVNVAAYHQALCRETTSDHEMMGLSIRVSKSGSEHECEMACLREGERHVVVPDDNQGWPDRISQAPGQQKR